jgi:hypothetical protein
VVRLDAPLRGAPKTRQRRVNIENLESLEMNLSTHNIDEQRIRETAYHLWERDGRPAGEDYRHWEMAKKIAVEAELAKSAPAAASAPKKKRAAPKKTLRVQ